MSEKEYQKPRNPRITARERGLVKGALRRAFSRSDLRRQVLEASIMRGYTDPNRPRVKTWCRCAICNKPTPKSYVEIDHILPLIPVDRSFEEMSLDEVVDRLWCDPANLQAICPEDHDIKTKAEAKARREHKKRRKAAK